MDGHVVLFGPVHFFLLQIARIWFTWGAVFCISAQTRSPNQQADTLVLWSPPSIDTLELVFRLVCYSQTGISTAVTATKECAIPFFHVTSMT